MSDDYDRGYDDGLAVGESVVTRKCEEAYRSALRAASRVCSQLAHQHWETRASMPVSTPDEDFREREAYADGLAAPATPDEMLAVLLSRVRTLELLADLEGKSQGYRVGYEDGTATTCPGCGTQTRDDGRPVVCQDCLESGVWRCAMIGPCNECGGIRYDGEPCRFCLRLARAFAAGYQAGINAAASLVERREPECDCHEGLPGGVWAPLCPGWPAALAGLAEDIRCLGGAR